VSPPLAFCSLVAFCVLSAACSTSLSPYAVDPESDEEDDAERAPAAHAPATRPVATVGTTTTSGPASPSPTTPVVTPPSLTPTAPSPPAPTEPWFSLDQPLPTCAIRELTSDCPAPELVLLSRARALPCRADQVGKRCAYPSGEGDANLLECVLAANGRSTASWQIRRERCSRSCREALPNSFAPLAGIACDQRPVYPCDGAGTEQTSIDNALGKIAADCGARPTVGFGLLMNEEGCGRALFVEDVGPVAKCISDEVMRWRFGCTPLCVSTREPRDLLID